MKTKLPIRTGGIKMRSIGTYFNVGKVKSGDGPEATHASAVDNYVNCFIQESETPETLPETRQVDPRTVYMTTDHSSLFNS